jgi:hypothetical protein
MRLPNGAPSCLWACLSWNWCKLRSFVCRRASELLACSPVPSVDQNLWRVTFDRSTCLLQRASFSRAFTLPSEFLRSTSRSARLKAQLYLPGFQVLFAASLPTVHAFSCLRRLAPTRTASRCEGIQPPLRSAHRLSQPLGGFLRQTTRESVSPHNHVQDSSRTKPQPHPKARFDPDPQAAPGHPLGSSSAAAEAATPTRLIALPFDTPCGALMRRPTLHDA